MELAALLKPAPFVVQETGDPEQLLQDFKDYMKTFKKFLTATKIVGEHTASCKDCGACVQARATLDLVGGKEIITLFEHVGGVLEADTYDKAVKKVEDGILLQTNQATARFKLYTKLPQGGLTFVEWYPKVKEQADRCIWTGYGAKQAARDALLFQTDSAKLQKKIIAEDLDYDNVVKYGLAFEQGEKKVDSMRAHTSGVRQEKERVSRLEDKVRQLETNKGGGSKSCRTCTRGGHEGKCPGLGMTCFSCNQEGHMKNSRACKQTKPPVKPPTKKKKGNGGDKARQVAEGSELDTDSEDVDRVVMEELVRSVKQESARKATVHMTVVDHGTPGRSGQVQLLIDSGVYKTLLSEKDWKTVSETECGRGKMRLKVNKTKFRPFGTDLTLPILGRTKCRIKAKCGEEVFTIIYVVKGETESLLGLKDAEALGIIQIKPEGSWTKGEEAASVRQLHEMQKAKVKIGDQDTEQSRRERQLRMEQLIQPHEQMFQGIGVAKVTPVHIEIDKSVKPVQQKRRPIALHYMTKFKDHLEELHSAGVISGPLQSESAGGWIHNVVITQKSWTNKKIRVNLDTRPMKEAVKTTHFPIPTPQELRHNFAGSDTYSVVDLNHSFHQFTMDEESQECQQ